MAAGADEDEEERGGGSDPNLVKVSPRTRRSETPWYRYHTDKNTGGDVKALKRLGGDQSVKI